MGQPTALSYDGSIRTGSQLVVHELDVPRADALADAVREGLTGPRKWLPPHLHYDGLGSKLFEAICLLPEYYLTRTEATILHDHAGEMVARLGGPARVVELGSGSSIKTVPVLGACFERQDEVVYVPIDVSRAALEQAGDALLEAFPQLHIEALAGSYEEGLRAARASRSDDVVDLVLFLGSSIGNLAPADAVALLSRVRELLGDDGALLLGTDLKKSPQILLPAYDDAIGVTEAFTKNLLVRMNRELGADFDPRRFRHVVEYDADAGRIQIFLESRETRDVHVRMLDLVLHFERGERIHTENSHKYDADDVDALAAAAGMRCDATWTDPRGLFRSNLLVPA